MKTKTKIIVSILVLILATIAIVNIVDAGGNVPDGIELFYPDDNFFCVMDDGVFQDCYSCCDNNCGTGISETTIIKEETTIIDNPIPDDSPPPYMYQHGVDNNNNSGNH